MIGAEYHGEIYYISKLEDLQDIMEPSVYEALVKSMDSGLIYGLKEKYDELKEDYDMLQSDYYELEGIEDDLHEEKEKRDYITSKYEAVQEKIEKIINDLYLGYLPQQDILPELEKIKNSF